MNEFGSNFGAHNYKYIGIHKIHYDLSLWRNITFVFSVCSIFFRHIYIKMVEMWKSQILKILVLAKVRFLKLLKHFNQNKIQ